MTSAPHDCKESFERSAWFRVYAAVSQDTRDDVRRDALEAENERLRRRVAELEALAEQRHHASAALKVSERRFRSLIQNIRGMVFYRGEANGDVHVYGADVHEFANNIRPDGTADLDTWYACIHPDDRDNYLTLERRRREAGHGYTFEFRYIHPETGRQFWARERAYVVEGENGRRFNDGYIIDITDEKEQQQKLQEAVEAALMADRVKSQFLANMSHELRTPLNAIIGFAEILMNEAFGPLGSSRYIEYCADIHSSATHLQRIIEDILDVSKAEESITDLHEALVDVPDTVHAAVRMVRERAANKGLALITELDEHLPQLRADERKMRQILLNLLSNAVKFTQAGGRVWIRAYERPDGGLTMAIIDTGIGMAAEEIPQALEPFVQIHTGLARHFEGTGLGLPLSHRLAHMHGGRLELDSRPGEGTEVRVLMPPDRSIRPPLGVRPDAD